MSLIGLLVTLLVFCAIYWVAMKILRAFGIGDPIATIVQVILVILGLLWLLGTFGIGPGLHIR